MKKLALLSAFFVCCMPLLVHAQKDSTAKSEFSANLTYQSYLHYFGRSDSLKSSGYLPSVGYQLKNGLYAQGTFIFIQNAALPTQYTGTSLEAGYRFGQNKHINGNLFFTKFLYADNSVLVQSALQYQSGINLAFTNPVLNINTGADIKFSSKTDIGTTIGADHLFIIKIPQKPMAFAIDPSFYTYLGTQNFSQTYVEKKNVLGIPVGQQQVTTNVTSFNILSYEASMPIVFVAGKFNAAVIPSYVMPQHLIAGENGQNMFYLTLTLGVKL